jgi:tRNA-(ms[2]io[6]A)-hydroxylase
MLNLASDTRPDWIHQALAEIDVVLLDHAFCEKKAASSAIGLVFKYPHLAPLARPLSELAREELGHFELMLDVLEKRDIPLRRLKPSSYAGRLREAVRKEEPGQLIDTLLCMALIEARSCERMKWLAEHLPDPELAALYKGLLASEARHHVTYVDLAEAVAPDEDVRARLTVLAAHEARVLETPDDVVRMHS